MQRAIVTLVTLGSWAALAQQMLRYQCSQLTVERLDPVVHPGARQSPHLQQVVGGSSFDMLAADHNLHDPVGRSNCTTCSFSDDYSNYWTASLFFRARNGTFKRVPQMPNLGLRGEGGITVYYIPPYDGRSRVVAFRPGFRMVAGDPAHRQAAGQQRQICHRCLSDLTQNKPGGPPCTGLDTASLPRDFCPGGIRTTITFPTCWDGRNYDSADHRSHVAYPATGSFESGGPCPASHPVHLPQLVYEIVWDTREFNKPEMWPENGSQPMVYSFGDTVGYGQYGGYMYGWKSDALQRALDARCTMDKCKKLKVQSTEDAVKCKKAQTVPEQIEGWLPTLPGNPFVN
ncbi:hypothetical protein RB597_008524 [Gaeumannomyces tritici]